MSTLPAVMPAPDVMKELRTLPRAMRKATERQLDQRQAAVDVVSHLGNGSHYNDGRLEIRRRPSGTVFVSLVALNVTVAEFAGDMLGIYRPGRWLTYLANLAIEARRKAAEKAEAAREAERARWAEIDDSGVFPEIMKGVN